MVNNPDWYKNFPLSPYTAKYPSWDKLMTVDNKWIRAILKPYNVNWPKDINVGIETGLEEWHPQAYYRPTPVGSWKILPHQSFMQFFGDKGMNVLSVGLYQTANAGPCVTHSWVTSFYFRYWVPHCVVFEIAVPKINHQFSMAITANEDGTTNVLHFDIFWNDLPYIMTPGVIPPKFNGGSVVHIYLP